MKKTIGILLIMVGAGLFSFNGCNRPSGKIMDGNGTIKSAPVMQTGFNWLPLAGALVFISGVIITTRRPKAGQN